MSNHVTFVPRASTCVSRVENREQASHTVISDAQQKQAEEETGLQAARPVSSVAIKPGSLKETHRDVHGIYDTFVSDDTEKLDLSRPPYAKKPSDRVLEEMVDWERVKQEQLDALRSDPVYRFLADLATHARVDVQDFLQTKVGSLSVGREFVERQEEAQLGITPEPSERVLSPQQRRQEIRRRRRQQRLQQQRLRTGEETAVSEANAADGMRKRKQQRADLSRRERIEAYDARVWLYRVEVIGRFAISDRAITAINYNYTRTLANAPHLNGVPVSYFMFSEHVNQLFAELCGIFLNNVDFRSRRTYIEISMSPEYKGAMRNLILAFKHAVQWDSNLRQLVLNSNPYDRNGHSPCQLTVYRRADGGCPALGGLQLCTTGATTMRLYPC